MTIIQMGNQAYDYYSTRVSQQVAGQISSPVAPYVSSGNPEQDLRQGYDLLVDYWANVERSGLAGGGSVIAAGNLGGYIAGQIKDAVRKFGENIEQEREKTYGELLAESTPQRATSRRPPNMSASKKANSYGGGGKGWQKIHKTELTRKKKKKYRRFS